MNDVINNPSHYELGPYQSREVLKEMAKIHAETFNGAVAADLYNAGKYIVRCGRKGDPIEDLNKAINYLNDAKEEIGKIK